MYSEGCGGVKVCRSQYAPIVQWIEQLPSIKLDAMERNPIVESPKFGGNPFVKKIREHTLIALTNNV